LNPESKPDWWDPWSCQPYKLPKEEKPRLGAANLYEYLKVASTFLLLSPAVVAAYLRPPARTDKQRTALDFVGLSVTPQSEHLSEIEDMIAELGVRRLLLRVPAWEAGELDRYQEFMARFPGHDFVINILQSRDSVARPEEWQQQLDSILRSLGNRASAFQIGNAINRSKWGCRHTGDWLQLMDRACRAAESIGNIQLAGSSVIDFEPLLTLRTLVNLHPQKFDVCAALLYINRRGSAFGRQYGFFDLERKIRLVHAMSRLSNKCPGRLWITETNWPLLDTKPYTPNSGHPRSTVDEATQARYLTQYYQVAWHSQRVERVYWWQLINPGYGLVDHRQGGLRKMPSYHAFKRLLEGEIEEQPKPD